MYRQIVHFLQGQVLVRIERGCPERMLNLCGARGLPFWALTWESPVCLTLRAGGRDPFSYTHLDVYKRQGMTFLVQQTLIYAVPLMIVALAGVFAERSGIINLALEGIMIFGAFIGVLFVRLMQGSAAVVTAQQSGNWAAMQGLELLAMLVAAAMRCV